MYPTTRRLYPTADDRLCEGHDPDALYLLAPAGVMLPEATAQRYKLREADAAREADSTSSDPDTDEEPAGDTDETDAADSEPETADESTDAEAEDAPPKKRGSKSRAS